MREQDFAVQILVQLGILEIACSGFIDSARIGAVVDDDRTVFKFCALNALFPGQCRAMIFLPEASLPDLFSAGQRVQLVIALRQRNVRCDSAGV